MLCFVGVMLKRGGHRQNGDPSDIQTEQLLLNLYKDVSQVF